MDFFIKCPTSFYNQPKKEYETKGKLKSTTKSAKIFSEKYFMLTKLYNMDLLRSHPLITTIIQKTIKMIDKYISILRNGK